MKLGYCQKYHARWPVRVADSRGVLIRRDHRARLQAVPIFILDGVLLVVEHAVQAFVKMRHVIATVEIVVHEHFPVAVQAVRTPLKEVNGAEIERDNPSNQPAQKVRQVRGFGVEAHEDELFPGFHPNGEQAVLPAIEGADGFELWRALQRAIQAVAPAVIWTAENTGRALGFGHDRGGVMPADVVERTQLMIGAAHDDQWFACEIDSNILARLLELIGSRDDLPRATKHILAFEFGYARVNIP